MEVALALIGVILAVVSIVINVIQYLRDKSTKGNILAAKGNFDSISDMCKNALRSPELIGNPEAVKQTLIAIRYMARSGNNTLDTALSRTPAQLAHENDSALEKS